MNCDLKYCIFETDWGFFGLLANGKSLLKTSLPADTYENAKKIILKDLAQPAAEKPIFPHLRNAVKDYYKGKNVNFDNLDVDYNFTPLTDFSKKVLLACKAVKPGQTITYNQLASIAGNPRAARAAGSVMAANKWPLLIGCHRIVRADGAIGRFSAPGGTSTKKRMLKHEIKFRKQ